MHEALKTPLRKWPSQKLGVFHFVNILVPKYTVIKARKSEAIFIIPYLAGRVALDG
jgi:hypothetical protein